MKKHIPNLITLCNSIAGSLGVVLAFRGEFTLALLAMLAAAVFDFFDGLTARTLGVSGPLGKELDSLSDCISFGLLPAVMLYLAATFQQEPGVCYTWMNYGALLIVPFSVYRLGKFNIDSRQSLSFLGLATPANALLCASFAAWVSVDHSSWGWSLIQHPWFIAIVSLCLGLLLISDVPMFSMKFGKGTPRREWIVRGVFAGLTATCLALALVIHLHWTACICLIFVIYILVNLIADIVFPVKSQK